MARPLRIQFEGALYHLMVRGNHRQPLFRDDRDRRHYLELLRHYRKRFGFRLYAYVLLRREVELLLETPKGRVSKVMQCLGTSYTSYFNRRHRRRGGLLEGRYRSFVLPKESALAEATRYIHRIHFHSGGGKKRDYPWSSYRVYLGRRMSDLVDARVVLRKFGRDLNEQRRRYRDFVERVEGGKDHFPAWIDPGPEENHGRESPIDKAKRIVSEIALCMAPDGTDLRAKRKNAPIRHMAMYVIRKETKLPLRSIGEFFGVKAPAVALAISRIGRLLEEKGSFGGPRELLKTEHPFLLEAVRAHST